MQGVEVRVGPASSREQRVTPTRAAETRLTLGSSRYGYTFRRILLLSDLLALVLATQIAMGALSLAGRGSFAVSEWIILVLSVPLWLVLAQLVGLYHLGESKVEHTFADELGPIFLATTLWIWLYQVAAAAALDTATTMFGPGVLWLAVMVCVLLLRGVARALARGRSWFRRTIALVGDEDGTEQVLRRIVRHPEWGLDPVAAIRFAADESVRLDHLDGCHVRYSEAVQAENGVRVATSQVVGTVKELNVDRAIITGGPRSLAERTELMRTLAESQFCVDYVSGEPEALYSSAVLHHLEGLPILTVQPTRIWRGSGLIKRGVDLVLATTGLIVLAPVLAYAAVRIKVDSHGPVLFRQPRIGKEGRQFQMLKFRTMIEDADAMRSDLREFGIHGNGSGMFKLRDDPRVTEFGAKLRRWSLDELPQLWNVLRGDMSLVGPRPLPLDEAPLVTDHWEQRMRVRPGITGPWQTQGRSDIPFEDMVKLDYTYVVGWSLREDFRLLLRTLATVLRGRGAY